MNTLDMIQTLSRIGKILSRIAFIFAVITFCGCTVGIVGIAFGSDSYIKLGGVSLHSFIANSGKYDSGSIIAALSGISVIAAGEAVTAKFAEAFFKNELAAGTPFTLDGARELCRLGILSIAVSIGCSVFAAVTSEIAASVTNATESAAFDIRFGVGGNIALGVMFIVTSLLCRYGAQIKDA